MWTLAPEAGISGRDKWLHPTEYCGMQLLIPAWVMRFWHQNPHIHVDGGRDMHNTWKRKSPYHACSMWLSAELTMSCWPHDMKTVSNYWPFVRGIHQLLVDSPHKGSAMQSFDVCFEMPWLLCNVIVIQYLTRIRHIFFVSLCFVVLRYELMLCYVERYFHHNDYTVTNNSH